MNLRPLGRSGLQVSPLAFGCNVFGWTVDEATSFKLLDAWFENGFNFIDTADVYSRWVPGHVGGESETIIGKWLKKRGKRNDVILATKVGKDMGAGKATDMVGLKPAYIRRAVEASLKRLQTDYIDLYQSHDDDASTPLEDVLGTYTDLIKEGKVRAIGASNYTGARLQEALDVSKKNGLARYESLQPLYNLYDRKDYEEDLEPVVLKEEVGVINFYALAAGFLTGKYRTAEDASKSKRGASTTAKYLNERGLRILTELDEVAERYESTPAQVALAWQIARPSITAPIASATSLDQLEQLVAGAKLQLDADAIEDLDQASGGF